MDVEIECTDISVEALNSFGNKLSVKCYNVDCDFLESDDVMSCISVTDYINKSDNNKKQEILDEILSEFDISDILDHYTKEEVFEQFTLDDILDYFKENMIKHI